MRKFLFLILIGAFAFGTAGYRAKEIVSAANNIEETTDVQSDGQTDNKDDKYVSAYPGFKVSSESLHDGNWDEDMQQYLRWRECFSTAFLGACRRCGHLCHLYGRHEYKQLPSLEIRRDY